MKWRPHTEPPTHREIFTALLARRGDDGEYFLLASLYYWKDGGWIEEATGKAPDTDRPFWWLPESEVLENLKGVTHEIERSPNGTTDGIGN